MNKGRDFNRLVSVIENGFALLLMRISVRNNVRSLSDMLLNCKSGSFICIVLTEGAKIEVEVEVEVEGIKRLELSFLLEII